MGVIEFIGLRASWGCLSWLRVTSPVAPFGTCICVRWPQGRTPCGLPLRPKGHMCLHAAMTIRYLGSVGLVVSFARPSAPMVASCVRSFGRSAGGVGVRVRLLAASYANATNTSLPHSRPPRPPLRSVRARCLGFHAF